MDGEAIFFTGRGRAGNPPLPTVRGGVGNPPLPRVGASIPAVETPYSILNPFQSRMRQLKKGAGKEEPLVRMEAGRSPSLQLVTGNQVVDKTSN